VYRKAHLWDAEKKIFTPGDDAPPVVELPFGNVGLMICYDLEFPEWVRLAALSGADLIAVPVSWAASGSPAPPGQRSGEVVSAQAAASANGVFIAVADRCGNERGVDWLGGSVILRRGGYPAAGPVCENRAAVLTATIDLRLARDKRISELNDLFTDRRPDLYARLWDNAVLPAGGAPPAPSATAVLPAGGRPPAPPAPSATAVLPAAGRPPHPPRPRPLRLADRDRRRFRVVRPDVVAVPGESGGRDGVVAVGAGDQRVNADAAEFGVGAPLVV
jgi:hypothetical protein